MFHEHNPYLTSLVRKSKRMLQERANQDKSPSYIYIMNNKCLDVILSKGKEGKNNMSEKKGVHLCNCQDLVQLRQNKPSLKIISTVLTTEIWGTEENSEMVKKLSQK
jgi:hypothetical protein